MSDRRFRFGVQAHQAADGPGWTGFAQRAGEFGYSTLLVMDHFGDQLGPVPAMTSAAAATRDLRVGSLVCDNDYRHPSPSPRTSPRSTCSPAAGSNSASAPAG
jgi:alkanesulfonate monooxygenase SsuD/methylene tetrahydromethanopterin reductase-like flavin-dependent oxidoreductase (luciferase family)